MKDLSNITTWQNSFGLLPIHLRPVNSESNFVLLNGGYGDFCLQTNKSDASPEDYFSESWSSNTKNFIVINNNKTEIYNWQKNNVEIISNEQVSKNFDKFYTYLLSKSYKSERDVIPFIIDIFRQFRNLTREKTNPTEALNLLFLLLTSLEENLNINIDFEKWGIKETSIPSGFGYYVDRLKENNIKPHLDLIIRHSSGALFQEAQKEVLFFNPQMELFGGVSNKLNSKENLYSSVHYTPAYIARTIVENALEKLDLSKTNIKIFDPACGSCEFLIEALKQLKEKNYNGSVQIVGWDTSATAVNTSTFLLTFEKRKVWGDKLTFNIELVTDSLLKKWDEDYDLILMNPPFVSWELLESKEARDAVKETLNINFSGRPNQASAFFYKSVKSLSNHGVIGCVIPSSLLTLDSYKKLRSDINEQLSINLIAKLGNFIFEDALTDVSILVGHKPKINDLVPTILWSRNEKGIANEALRDLRKMNYTSQFTINKIDYSIFQPIQFPIVEDSWRPISVTQNQLLKKVNRFVIDKKLYPVKDIFKVQQGINSGNNVFKINKEEYLQLPKNEQLFFRPVIDNSSIKYGQIYLDQYIWYPYNSNGAKIHTEEELVKLAPSFSNKLYPIKDSLKKRPSINPSQWWLLSRHRNWLIENEPRLFSTRFGNSDSFAFDINGTFTIENGNAWIPKKEFELDYYYFYLALFSSEVFDDLLSIYSRQLSGGRWYDLGGKYTHEIPIPNVFDQEIRSTEGYKLLVDIGNQLTLGNTYIKSMTKDILLKFFYPEDIR